MKNKVTCLHVKHPVFARNLRRGAVFVILSVIMALLPGCHGLYGIVGGEGWRESVVIIHVGMNLI